MDTSPFSWAVGSEGEMASRKDPVEIKVNIGGDVEDALRHLGLSESRGVEREIWFLDDITEGLRDVLPLLNSGVILRLRRPKEDNGGREDSTVKLRPCRRSQLVGMWDAPHKDGPEYRIEGDWSRKRRVLGASCVAEFAPGTFQRVLTSEGPLSGAFSDYQRTFLTECSDLRFTFAGLTALGPIAATQWKDVSCGGVERITAERWRIPGMDVLELSIRIKSGGEDAAAAQDDLEDAVRHGHLEFDQSKDPKTDRVMRRLANLD